MVKEIQLKGLAAAGSGHSSADGLLSLSIGCMPRQGELQAIPPLATVLTLPAGHRAVLRHGSRFIVSATDGADTALSWTDADGTLRPIATVEGACTGFACMGSMVAVATAKGLRFMTWRGSDYAYLGAAPALPEIEFGMQRAGYLAFADKFEIPAHMAPAEQGAPGSGAWTTHPSTEAEAGSGEATAKEIERAFARAVAAQAEAKGLFYQPFLVRYGLRLPDGSLPWVSAPVLMSPWILPPCLALESATEADGKVVATLSSASCPLFRLRRRILTGLAAEWAQEVASVDVFITPAIPTYDSSLPGTGFVAFSTVCDAKGTDLAGCWAESGDAYAAHTLASTGLADAPAWAWAKSGSLRADICQASSFFLAESIPVAELAASAEWTDASLGCTSRRAIEGAERLSADAGMPWVPVPERVDAACGRLFAIGGSLRAPEPARIQCAAQARAESASEPTEVAVWIKREGKVAVARRAWTDAAPDLARAFPLMLAYPCRDACMMQLSQGGRHWRLPLTPHSVLDCACWLGALTTDPGAGFEALWTDDADPAESPLLAAPDCFAPSAGTSAFAFCTPRESLAGKVMGVRAAVGALSPGQLGQFAAYAICSDGVMALSADTFVPRQLLSSQGCIAPGAIVEVGTGVAYASRAGLMMLQGWKCESLCPAMKQSSATARSLPGLDRLAQMAGAALPVPSLARVLRRGTLAYDRHGSRLLALSDEWPGAYVCALPDAEWGVAVLPAIATAIGGSAIMLANGTVADAETEAPTAEGRCLVVTHPIKADHPVERKRLAAAMAEGRLSHSASTLAVYGSNDLVAWSLVASAHGRSIDGVAGSPWRYYAGALAATLGPADSISALTLSFH